VLVTSTTPSFSSAGNLEDILRVIAPYDREAFSEMLKPANEQRRVAEQTCKKFLKESWPVRPKCASHPQQRPYVGDERQHACKHRLRQHPQPATSPTGAGLT
jgi:hypothetical protein